jgi:DNA-binding CsgD family transcriptional regulator
MKQPLTDRQSGIVELLALGWNTKEIATHFNILPETVQKTIHDAFIRTGAKSRIELAAFFWWGDDGLTPDEILAKLRYSVLSRPAAGAETGPAAELKTAGPGADQLPDVPLDAPRENLIDEDLDDYA